MLLVRTCVSGRSPTPTRWDGLFVIEYVPLSFAPELGFALKDRCFGLEHDGRARGLIRSFRIFGCRFCLLI
jgi:hypothetical protein